MSCGNGKEINVAWFGIVNPVATSKSGHQCIRVIARLIIFFSFFFFVPYSNGYRSWSTSPGQSSTSPSTCFSTALLDSRVRCWSDRIVASLLFPSPGQMFLLDRFFDGLFWEYGWNVMRFAYDNFQGRNPMIAVFPRMTKCSAKVILRSSNYRYNWDVYMHCQSQL